MLGAALALDVLVYHRFLPYQPGWAALPLGVLELAATMGLVFLLPIDAPLRPAIWFFVGSWILAQVLAHAVLPLARLTYAEDGGELGLAGRASPPRAVLLLVVLGTAAATSPHDLPGREPRRPLVLDHSQTLGAGAVVRGGSHTPTTSSCGPRDRGREYGVAIEGPRTSSSTASRSPALDGRDQCARSS
jgi:hypothetical protein